MNEVSFVDDEILKNSKKDIGGWVLPIRECEANFENSKKLLNYVFKSDSKIREINFSRKRERARILVFNFSGDRDPKSLLESFVDCEFDALVLVPFDSTKETLSTREHVVTEYEFRQLKLIETVWKELNAEGSQIFQFVSINNFLRWLLSEKEYGIDILITGSLYLVGDFLYKASLLDMAKKLGK